MNSRRKHDSQRSPAPSIPVSATRMRAARPAPARTWSGEYLSAYARVRAVLLRHLSPILVDSVLERAMSARHQAPGALRVEDLAELTSEIMVGLRLFVEERDLPELMLELAEILEAEEGR